MIPQIVVKKGRTTVLSVSLGYDASADTFTSQIREGKDKDSELIATWVPSFATDGTDGELLLTLDNTVTTAITQATGYMDIKRVVDGEPKSVFSEILEVSFENTVTA